MRVGLPFALAVLVLLLLALSLTVQAVALTTSYWAHFTARTDLGKPEEKGHFGLWTVCSVKAPKWSEDCDPMDTFYEAPPYALVAGALAIVQMLQVLLLIPLVSVRAVQIARLTSNIAIKSKFLCIANVAIAFLAVIFAILVAIFASVGEKKPEYTVKKGWSFWVQIAVIVIDFVVALLCAGENFRFWQQHIREHSDPWGHHSETYGNPTFESGSPSLPRGASERNGDPIAFTNTSGQPVTSGILPPPVVARTKQASSMLTYENPSYQESSPTLRISGS